MAILSKGCKPDNFESCNSLKLSFTSIWGFCLNFTDCVTFLESNSLGFFCSIELYWLNSFWQFYLPLIWKDSITHIHGLAFYVKERLSFAQDLRFYYSYARSCVLYKRRAFFCTGLASRKLCRFLLMFPTSFTSLSVLLLVPLSITFFDFTQGFWFYII